MFYILNIEQASLIGTELLLGLLGWRARELPFGSTSPPCYYYELLLARSTLIFCSDCMSDLSLASSGGTPNLKDNQKVFMHNHGEETVDLSGVGRRSIAPS